MAIHRLNPQDQPLTWQERLDDAATEVDVVDVARDYLATLTHAEYKYLPENLRPIKIVDASDVTTYAFDLVRAECDEAGAQRLVQGLAHVMSRASIRLSEIMVAERSQPGHRRTSDHTQSA